MRAWGNSRFVDSRELRAIFVVYTQVHHGSSYLIVISAWKYGLTWRVRWQYLSRVEKCPVLKIEGADQLVAVLRQEWRNTSRTKIPTLSHDSELYFVNTLAPTPTLSKHSLYKLTRIYLWPERPPECNMTTIYPIKWVISAWRLIFPQILCFIYQVI